MLGHAHRPEDGGVVDITTEAYAARSLDPAGAWCTIRRILGRTEQTRVSS
jgi:hypothetical protein